MSNPLDFPNKPRPSAGLPARVAALIPGIAVCTLVAVIAMTVQALQEIAVGHPYVEAIVIAILLGTAIRTVWKPGSRWLAGIAFSAKQLLEVAVALLGASVTLAAIAASGLATASAGLSVFRFAFRS